MARSLPPAPRPSRAPEPDPQLTVWTHSQGVYPLRAEIARATGIAAETITVTHVEGAGCYGHNAADDVAYEAVLLARATPGRPVHVTWSREDELGWGPFGAAMVVEITSTSAPDGTIESWTADAWGNGHTSRPGTLPTPAFLAYSLQESGIAIPPSADPRTRRRRRHRAERGPPVPGGDAPA